MTRLESSSGRTIIMYPVSDLASMFTSTWRYWSGSHDQSCHNDSRVLLLGISCMNEKTHQEGELVFMESEKFQQNNIKPLLPPPGCEVCPSSFFSCCV